jgi:hypothetical protein
VSDEKSRQRILGQARADLTELPDMIDTLSRQLDATNNGEGGTGKITGSPALISLDILTIVDPDRKEGWDGEDPRLRQLAQRYGATATLEAWVRVIWEETDLVDLTETPTVRSEAAVILEYWNWITDQEWATYLAEDISDLATRCRQALGIRPEYRPRCRYCRSKVIPVEAGGVAETTWEACAYGYCLGCHATFPPGPALTALARTQEPMPLSQIAEQTGIPLRTLQRWAVAETIKPAPNREGRRVGRLFDLAEVRESASQIGRVMA